MKGSIVNAKDDSVIVDRIKNFVSQHVVSSSLPFTTCASSKGEEEKARKWIDTKVCRIFDTPDGPRRFHGVVLRIEFHDIHGRWMYRVRYEDGDECDYWRYELGEVLCRCEDNI